MLLEGKGSGDGIARHHNDPALVVGDRTCTYADLLRLSHALAGPLSERGIHAGDRIAFLLPNGPEVVLCYYACFILGAIAVPLNIRFPPELIAYVLDHSEARVLISEPELFARIAPSDPSGDIWKLSTWPAVAQSPESRTSAIRCAPVQPRNHRRLDQDQAAHSSTCRARPAPRRASFRRMAA